MSSGAYIARILHWRGKGGTEGALFSSKKKFSRRPENLSSCSTGVHIFWHIWREHFWQREQLLYGIKQALCPDKTSFPLKKSTRCTIGGAMALPPWLSPGCPYRRIMSMDLFCHFWYLMIPYVAKITVCHTNLVAIASILVKSPFLPRK